MSTKCALRFTFDPKASTNSKAEPNGVYQTRYMVDRQAQTNAITIEVYIGVGLKTSTTKYMTKSVLMLIVFGTVFIIITTTLITTLC